MYSPLAIPGQQLGGPTETILAATWGVYCGIHIARLRPSRCIPVEVESSAGMGLRPVVSMVAPTLFVVRG